jgi:hypothetical protein
MPFLCFILYLSFIYHLVPAAAACVRYSADDACHYYLLYIIHHLSFINHLVPAAAACRRHPAAA